jgi:Lipocalin-like domain
MARSLHRHPVAVLLLVLGMATPSNGALAQTAKDLAGTWTWLSIEGTRPDGTKYQPFGPNPKGHIVFDSNGYFAFLCTSSGRPHFAAKNREQGTADENRLAMQGSIAYSGAFSVNGNTLIFDIKASNYPNAEGIRQMRTVTLSGDELRYYNPAPTMGGTAEVVLKRVKE